MAPWCVPRLSTRTPHRAAAADPIIRAADKNPDNREAAEKKFKEVAAAYEVPGSRQPPSPAPQGSPFAREAVVGVLCDTRTPTMWQARRRNRAESRLQCQTTCCMVHPRTAEDSSESNTTHTTLQHPCHGHAIEVQRQCPLFSCHSL